MTTTATWLDAETSHAAIEALADMWIVMEDDPDADPSTMTPEEARASRAAARVDEERWRDARDTVSRRAMIVLARAEMIGYDPTEEQADAYAKAGMTGWIFHDHLQDEQGRLINAGLLTSEAVDLTATSIHNHWRP